MQRLIQVYRWFLSLSLYTKFIVFTFVLLFVAIAIRLLTPTTVIAPNAQEITGISFGGSPNYQLSSVTLSATFPEVTALPVFKLSQGVSSLQFAEKSAAALNLQKVTDPGYPNYWHNSLTGELLRYEPAHNQVIYTREQPEEVPLLPESFDKNKAVQTAREFIQKINPTSAQVQQDKITYVLEEHSSSSQEATAVVIPFSTAIQDVPVYWGASTASFATVYVSSSYEVVKAEIQPTLPEMQLLETKTLFTATDIERSILAGNGDVAGASLPGVEVSIADITTLTVQQVRLEYRISEKNALMYPYYLFECRGRTRSGQSVELELLHPAVPL